MPYMNCPRCGLSIRLRALSLLLERCPRCLARSGAAIPMYTSENQPTIGPGPATPPPLSERRPTPLIDSTPSSPGFDLARREPGEANGSRGSIPAAEAVPPVPSADETRLSSAPGTAEVPPPDQTPATAEVPPPDQATGHGFVNEWSH
jgi:hypothetical protein